MKRYKLLLSLTLGISVVFSSCKKDFLDQPSEDQVEGQFFFNTAKDLEVATNDFYTMISSTAVYNEDAASDNIVPLITNDRVRGNRIVPTASGSGGWSWSRLRDINYFLANYEKVPDQAAKDKYSGVARFFRAYFYYYKVNTFGDVPWINKVLTADDPDLYKARDSRELVMDSVMADIDYAIANIPAEKQLNRITKYTALMLKARIALFEGTYRKYHGIAGHQHFLEEAASASEALMNTNAYTLYTAGGKDKAYRDLFARNNQDNVETILSVDYELGIKVHTLIAQAMTSPTYGAWGVTKDMINSYLLTNGTPFTDQANYQTKSYLDEMTGRDPRLTQTTAGPDFRVNGQTADEPVSLNATTTGYRVIKALPTRDQWSSSYFDIIVLRYAEALLVYAEAKAELGTLTQTDLNKSINLLRSRVDMPPLVMAVANANPDPYQEAMYPNVDQGLNKGVILEIRRERRVEMFNEGLRWDDLMRWKAGSKITQPMVGIYFPGTGNYDFTGNGQADVNVNTGSTSGAPSSVSSFINILQRTLRNPVTGTQNSPTGNLDPFPQGGVFDESRDYLAPIPLEDLKLNPQLEQNPNWN